MYIQRQGDGSWIPRIPRQLGCSYWGKVTIGERLPCKREPGNRKDPFAVAVVRSRDTVGHVPKKISSVCSMFLLHGGTLHCQVIASRGYSGDLPQGGLEILCMLTFEGSSKDVAKATRFLKCALSSSTEKDELPKKKVKYESQGGSTDEVNSILTASSVETNCLTFTLTLLNNF